MVTQTEIHPSAIIDPSAKIGENVEIGPFSIIGPNVEIGQGCKIGPYAQIKCNTRLGKKNVISHGCCIGEDPQDISKKILDRDIISIGDNNIFREFCTVHMPSKKNGVTKIGNNNFFMVNTHIAHDCWLQDNIIIANNTALGGHVEVHSNAFLSASVGIHQHSKIGSFVMVGAVSKVAQDVPPFVTVVGSEAKVHSLNILGIQRGGLKSDEKKAIKTAFKILYHENSSTKNALEKIEENVLKKLDPSTLPHERISYLVDFIRSSKRGILVSIRNTDFF